MSGAAGFSTSAAGKSSLNSRFDPKRDRAMDESKHSTKSPITATAPSAMTMTSSTNARKPAAGRPRAIAMQRMGQCSDAGRAPSPQLTGSYTPSQSPSVCGDTWDDENREERNASFAIDSQIRVMRSGAPSPGNGVVTAKTLIATASRSASLGPSTSASSKSSFKTVKPQVSHQNKKSMIKNMFDDASVSSRDSDAASPAAISPAASGRRVGVSAAVTPTARLAGQSSAAPGGPVSDASLLSNSRCATPAIDGGSAVEDDAFALPDSPVKTALASAAVHKAIASHAASALGAASTTGCDASSSQSSSAWSSVVAPVAPKGSFKTSGSSIWNKGRVPAVASAPTKDADIFGDAYDVFAGVGGRAASSATGASAPAAGQAATSSARASSAKAKVIVDPSATAELSSSTVVRSYGAGGSVANAAAAAASKSVAASKASAVPAAAAAGDGTHASTLAVKPKPKRVNNELAKLGDCNRAPGAASAPAAVVIKEKTQRQVQTNQQQHHSPAASPLAASGSDSSSASDAFCAASVAPSAALQAGGHRTTDGGQLANASNYSAASLLTPTRDADAGGSAAVGKKRGRGNDAAATIERDARSDGGDVSGQSGPLPVAASAGSAEASAGAAAMPAARTGKGKGAKATAPVDELPSASTAAAGGAPAASASASATPMDIDQQPLHVSTADHSPSVANMSSPSARGNRKKRQPAGRPISNSGSGATTTAGNAPGGSPSASSSSAATHSAAEAIRSAAAASAASTSSGITYQQDARPDNSNAMDFDNANTQNADYGNVMCLADFMDGGYGGGDDEGAANEDSDRHMVASSGSSSASVSAAAAPSDRKRRRDNMAPKSSTAPASAASPPAASTSSSASSSSSAAVSAGVRMVPLPSPASPQTNGTHGLQKRSRIPSFQVNNDLLLQAKWAGDAINDICSKNRNPSDVVCGPVICHARDITDVDRLVSQLMDQTCCANARVNMASVNSYRDLYEITLTSLAKSVIDLARGHLPGGELEVARSLMRSLTAAERGQSGRECAAALVRWADAYPGVWRAAFIEAVLHNYCGAGAGAGAAAAQTSASLDGAPNLTSGFVARSIGQARCTSLVDFVREIRFLGDCNVGDVNLQDPSNGCFGYQKLALNLVYVGAERLAAADPRMLQLLSQLRKMTSRQHINLWLLTSSPAVVFEPLRDQSNYGQAELIHFKSPPRETVEALLYAECKPGDSMVCWKGFIRRISMTFGPACGFELGEMRYIADKLWPFYFAPVLAGVCDESDSPGLAALSLPYFEHANKRLLDRDMDPSMALGKAYKHMMATVGEMRAKMILDQILARKPTLSATASATGSTAAPSSSSSRPIITSAGGRERNLETELPHYLKLLLVAAFCASHNPAETDARYFTRRATGRRKKQAAQQLIKKNLVQAVLEGPRPFPQERLLAIFHALVAMHDGVECSRNIDHDDLMDGLELLVSLHLIHRSFAVADYESLKYRCNISVSAAGIIAANVKVDLGKFLHENGS